MGNRAKRRQRLRALNSQGKSRSNITPGHTNNGEFYQAITDLLSTIAAIPGMKIVTMMIQGDSDPFVIDIDKDGKVGHSEYHLPLLLAKLTNLFASDGGIIVRQFLPVFGEIESALGHRMKVPHKNIYGIAVVDGKWTPVPGEECRICHSTDTSGQPIELEQLVHFPEFPMLPGVPQKPDQLPS